VGTREQAGGCYTSRLMLQRPKIRVVVDGLPLGTCPAGVGVADDVTFDACFLVYLACLRSCGACAAKYPANGQLQNGTYMETATAAHKM
jgi:hypothetical protein